MIGEKTKAPPDRTARWLGAAAAASIAAAALTWIAQAFAATRINSYALLGITFWLLACGSCAWRTVTLGPRQRLVADVLTIGALLERRASLCEWPPPTKFYGLIARRRVYAWSGYLAMAATATTAVAHILMAADVIHLRGPNFAIATLAALWTASECATIRIIGPQAAAATLAWRQAGVVARTDEETRSRWALASGD